MLITNTIIKYLHTVINKCIYYYHGNNVALVMYIFSHVMPLPLELPTQTPTNKLINSLL